MMYFDRFRVEGIALVMHDQLTGQRMLVSATDITAASVASMRAVSPSAPLMYTRASDPTFEVNVTSRNLSIHLADGVPQVQQRGIYLPGMHFHALPAPAEEGLLA